MDITNLKDIYFIDYHTSNTPHHTSVYVLGSMQLSVEDGSQSLKVFICRSSCNFNITESEALFCCDSIRSLSIAHIAWGEENMTLILR